MRSIDADALIQSLEKKHAHWHELVTEENKEIEFAHSYALNVIRNAPTVAPTVVRCKTMIPYGDFREWAKRIREDNPNVIVIPFDAEIVSDEAVQGWIPFKKRPLTDEEKQEYPDWTYIFDCPLPDDEEEILLSNGKYVWTDTFINDGECYLDGGDDIDDGMAWMPLPEPYREESEVEP